MYQGIEFKHEDLHKLKDSLLVKAQRISNQKIADLKVTIDGAYDDSQFDLDGSHEQASDAAHK